MKVYAMYHNQIEGFEEVADTVKAVEKIAAASVHWLKKQVINLDGYTDNIERTLARLALFYEAVNYPLLRQNRTGRKGLIIVTGNKGLVGGLWHEVVNLYLEKASDYQLVMVIGSKGKLFLEEEQRKVAQTWGGWDRVPKQEDVKTIVDYIFDEFKKGRLAKVDILYPRFVSLAEQKPMIVPWLPFSFAWDQAKQAKQGKSIDNTLGLPIFEPTKRQVFDRLLQKYIGIYLYRIILAAKLSELSARTVAMEHANAQTRNIIEKLKCSFRKERHRIMTQQQLESFVAHKV